MAEPVKVENPNLSVPWKCYGCGFIGTYEECHTFYGTNSINLNVTGCKQCKSEDVFPYRVFECTECGIIHDQGQFFPDADFDDIWERASEDGTYEIVECPNLDCESTTVRMVPVFVDGKLRKFGMPTAK